MMNAHRRTFNEHIYNYKDLEEIKTQDSLSCQRLI